MKGGFSVNKYRLDYSSLSSSEAQELINRIESRTVDGGAFNYTEHICVFVLDENSVSQLQIPNSCTLTRLP